MTKSFSLMSFSPKHLGKARTLSGKSLDPISNPQHVPHKYLPLDLIQTNISYALLVQKFCRLFWRNCSGRLCVKKVEEPCLLAISPTSMPSEALVSLNHSLLDFQTTNMSCGASKDYSLLAKIFKVYFLRKFHHRQDLLMVFFVVLFFSLD